MGFEAMYSNPVTMGIMTAAPPMDKIFLFMTGCLPSFMWILWRTLVFFGWWNGSQNDTQPHGKPKRRRSSVMLKMTNPRVFLGGNTVSIIAFFTHVICGLGLVAAIPYLGYLCAWPPNESLLQDPYHRFLLETISVSLLVVLFTTLVLLPNPYDKETDQPRLYNVTHRQLCEALNAIVAPCLSLIAMTLTPLALFFPRESVARTLGLMLSTMVYSLSFALGVHELSLEESSPKTCHEGPGIVRYVLNKVQIQVGSRKGISKQTSAFLFAINGNGQGEENYKTSYFVTDCMVSLLAFLQSVAMLYSNLILERKGAYNEEWFARREELMIVKNLYMTVVSSFGFFTSAKLFNKAANPKISDDDASLLKKLQLIDAVLTLLFPLLYAVAVGASAWLDLHTHSDYMAEYGFWGVYSNRFELHVMR